MRLRFKVDRSGLGLVTAMIFAFVCMTILAGLAYTIRLEFLSINALSNSDIGRKVDDNYLSDILQSNDFSSKIEETFDNYKFVTYPENISPIFYSTGSNAELYQVKPYAISNRLIHKFFIDGEVSHVTSIIVNQLANQTFTKYNNDILPINIPFVSLTSMSSAQSTYKLNNSNMLTDNKMGYIGYISRSNAGIDIHINSTTGTISNTTINNLNVSKNKYSLELGWNLKNGSWTFYITIYDGKYIYTSNTTLDNLLNNINQAIINLSSFNQVLNVPASGDIITVKGSVQIIVSVASRLYT